MKKIISPLLILLFTLNIAAKGKEPVSSFQVIPLNQVTNATQNALVYALPQTAIRVEVTAHKIIRKSGPFFRYSERYLGIKDVILKNETFWKIQDINLSSFGVPDPQHYYLIKSSGNHIAQNVSLTPECLLLAINSPKCQAPLQPQDNAIPTPIVSKDTLFSNVPFTEEQVIVNSTAAMAAESAKLIYRLREGRVSLLTGETDKIPQDGASFNKALEEISHLENEFAALFKGKEAVQVIKKVFYLVPKDAGKEVLFRFSHFKGFVASDDLSGAPIYVNVEKLKGVTIPSTTQPVGSKAPAPTNGFFYRIPQKAKVSILAGRDELTDQEFLIGQFGTVVSLPAGAFFSGEKSVEFYPETGAIKQIR